ncbi:hypothetical protein CSKR_100159 [Clonorchis sinensis]|uniref:Uncharacterized protein n=1 Tax=Clonorchis sinensis TaxID=79923 RepID=A0A419PPV5_CLOSI|nr:hypothetical protein CSKR_100159 [Clonorchis sinensis]
MMARGKPSGSPGPHSKSKSDRSRKRHRRDSSGGSRASSTSSASLTEASKRANKTEELRRREEQRAEEDRLLHRRDSSGGSRASSTSSASLTEASKRANKTEELRRREEQRAEEDRLLSPYFSGLQDPPNFTIRRDTLFPRWLKWLEREFTDRKVRGSNRTSASRLPLSRLGQPGSISALVLPSGGMAARHWKGDPPNFTIRRDTLFPRWLKWLEREFTDRKVRGSNRTSASRLPLSRLGQPGSISALVLPSGGMAARHWKGVTAQR